ncbi:MAG: MMPL family transporter [Gemmatimonadales bacterium]|nr:MMPL family transporter [Gemmatimonadales bacterium]
MAWLLLAAVAFPKAAHVDEVLRVEGQTLNDAESKLGMELIGDAFPLPITHFFVVTMHGPVPIDSLSYRAVLDSLTRTAALEPYISQTASYLSTRDTTFLSPDHRTTFFIAAARHDLDRSPTDYVPAFRQAIHSTLARINWASAYEVHVTGGPALDYDVRTVSKEDTRIGERKSLPFSAAILILAFGALVAAFAPIVIGVLAIVCALGLVHVAASFYPMSVFVLTIVSMVGLGVGIDYSLLIVTRFREEMNRGRGPREAAERTIDTAGRAVITSGLTVLLGFGALLITPTSETRSVGIGGLLVVSSAVLLSITLLPGALSLIGRAIDGPRWLARKLAWYHAPTGWERWARWLGHHPWRALILGGVLMAACSWPLTNIKIGLPREGWFPSNTESADALASLDAIGARGALQPVRIVVQAPEGERIVGTRYVRGLKRLSDSVRADAHVADLRSVVDLQRGTSILQYTMMYSNLERARARAPEFYASYLSEDGRTTLLDVILADTTSFTGAMDAVRHIRGIVRAGVPGLDSVRVFVAGFQAASVDLQDELLRQFPWVIILVVGATAVMLFVAFQSILVPVKAVVMNLLSVAGAFGILVLVFQHGVGAQILGLQGPTEAIYVAVPVVVFAVVFGLSMDYEVFLLSRIKEAFDRTGKNDQATMEGLTATASVITSAAAIMLVVFGTFAFSRVLAAQMLGFGLAVAVLLDATVIRMVLVPAFMHIAGSWNWWPGGRKVRRSVEGGGSGPRPVATPAPEPAPAVAPEGPSATPDGDATSADA